MAEVPVVKVFENITPVNAGSGDELFVYEGLEEAVSLYKQSHALRSAVVWESEDGTLEEIRAARQLAMEYLLRTASHAVEAPNGPSNSLWADRFTQASIELYGQPDPVHAAGLLSNEQAQLVTLGGNERISQPHLIFLLDTYDEILDGTIYPIEVIDDLQSNELAKEAIEKYGSALLERYQPLFDLVDDLPSEELSPEELRELFEKALEWLAEHDDPDWSTWEAIMKKGTSVSTSTADKQIRIGINRVPADRSTARKLLAHELLVHAMRGKNAHKSGDDLLIKGLPGFLEAEEGLGLLSEDAVEGGLNVRGRDRYINIALALGVIDEKRRSRSELFDISLARAIITAQVRGEYTEADLDNLERSIRGGIDRIFRGGKGEADSEKSAIYTKDIVYYNGYRKMVPYIIEQLSSGKSASDIFNYLSQGSFDPTNPKHIERLSRLHTAK